MKPVIILAVAGLLVTAGTAVDAQGTFQNLDFENGTFIPIPGDPYGSVQWAPAMPGWTGYIYTNQVTKLLYNNAALSTASVSICGPDYPSPGLFSGHYFVQLQTGVDPSGSGYTASPVLVQTGTLPASAKTIEFWSDELYGIGFLVSFKGQGIGLSLLRTTSNGCYVWGGDISAYAGQTGELNFLGTGYLDNIQFSNQPVPEPGVLCLAALGALLLGWRGLPRRRVRNSAVCSTCGRAADNIYGWKLCTVTAKSSYLSAASKAATIGR